MCNIYEIVNDLCKSKGISLTRMCSDLSISRSTFSELKAKRSKRLSFRNASAIAMYFDVPIEFLSASGVFENWDSIKSHIDEVFMQLKEDIPSNFYWHDEDDKYLYAYLDTYFYYGNDYSVFTKFLFENVRSIRISQFDDCDQCSVEIEYKESFEKRIIIARHENEENREIKSVTMQEAMEDFLDGYRPDDIDDVAELVRISNKLSPVSRRQLLRKAYELLFNQKSSESEEEETSPSNLDLASTVLGGRVKK